MIHCLDHPAHSLYGKRFDIFIGPCTDSDLLNNVIMNAGLFCGSADVLITFHELNGHPRLMLVTSAPCTRVENHPICCLLTLNDPDVLLPGSGPTSLRRILCGTMAAPANWHFPQSQSDPQRIRQQLMVLDDAYSQSVLCHSNAAVPAPRLPDCTPSTSQRRYQSASLRWTAYLAPCSVSPYPATRRHQYRCRILCRPFDRRPPARSPSALNPTNHESKTA